jgi:hypothetical protein
LVPIEFKQLGRDKTKFSDRDGMYIWVVRASNPNTIFYLDELDSRGRPATQLYECDGGGKRARNHSCIANNEPILCAGDFEVNNADKTVNIRNKSGHYLPDFECIDEDLKEIYQYAFDGYTITYENAAGEQFTSMFGDDY